MKIIGKLAVATAFVALAACGSNNSANNVDMNAADMNAGMTDMNAGMTDMNATTDMNSMGGNMDMNATGNMSGNMDMNADGNMSDGMSNNSM